VRVIPFDVDGFAGAGAMMFYAGGRVPDLDTVQRDAPYGSVFLDAPPNYWPCEPSSVGWRRRPLRLPSRRTTSTE
jgi:hypothetical protein